MSKVTFLCPDGSEHVIDAVDGATVMEAAIQNLVPGIDGDCGGVAACGTCHVYVDPAWTERAGGAAPGIERDMLALTDNAMPNSRLACQIRICESLDGLILRMPDNQH